MANIILFDSDVRTHLLPLTFLRPVGELRIGILTIREKWEHWMGSKVSHITQDYLAESFHLDFGDENLVINGSVLPSEKLCRLLQNMEFGDAYLQDDELIAAKLDGEQLQKLIQDEDIEDLHPLSLDDVEFHKINRLSDLYLLNSIALESDFHLLTSGRKSQPLSGTNRVIAPERVFLEAGARVEGAFLNAQAGPIYIGHQAEVMEGACIRGNVALCHNAVIKMGAQIYGATTIGPWCKAGGEIEQTIFQGYSNKAHAGYLGHSLIGEWCNIGAGTTISNLRNDYGPVRLWNYATHSFDATGQTFCGLIMGDHSRLGINMMINSGTSVGLASNLYGAHFPRNFIPSFTLAGPASLQTFPPEKAIPSMDRMMERRNRQLSIHDRLTLIRLFEETTSHRPWENPPKK